jgi:hypothetical protein
MMKRPIGLFAEQEREDRQKIGDPLAGLTDYVNFEALTARIDAAPASFARHGGRPPYPTVLRIR